MKYSDAFAVAEKAIELRKRLGYHYLDGAAQQAATAAAQGDTRQTAVDAMVHALRKTEHPIRCVG